MAEPRVFPAGSLSMPAVDELKLSGEYEKPTLDCDLVMKGGITSGVIYPLAICKLAENYRLHSIGGASAGAIAAAAAAAAEYSRQKGSVAGYKKLQGLPDAIASRMQSGRTRLLSLFQPTPTTRTAFDCVMIGISQRGVPAKIAAFVGLVLRRHPLWPLLAVALSTLLLLGVRGSLEAVAVALAVAVVVLAGIVGGVIVLALRVWQSIAENRGGICSGHAIDHVAGEPALCEWLADLFDDIAGVAGRRAPLTFGDLRSCDIELAMMTTSLTHGRPHRLPLPDDAGFFIAKNDLYALFPSRIAEHIEAAGRAFLATAPAEVQQTHAANVGGEREFIPLPPSKELPIVFGVRLSLSFPVLLSAVPLYAVDWTSVRHPNLDKLAKSEQTTRPSAELPPPGPLLLSRCWFSDGGICSNLPIHFFDALLPRRPTFALNLRTEHPRYPVWTADSGRSGSELDNVWVPESANASYAESWRYPRSEDLSIAELLASMVDTMQSWNDNMLSKAPGFRDRIVHITHRNDEGGLNLDMPQANIERLSLRGAAAGFKIGARFDRAKSDGWRNHLWVRYRSALAMLQSMLSTAHERYFVSPTGRLELETLLSAPPSYPFANPAEAIAASDANREFGKFTGFDLTKVDFSGTAPRPVSDLRPRPRGG